MAYDLLIDGDRVAGAGTLQIINPATGEVFAECARADEAQLQRAVAAAKRSFNQWASAGCEERGRVLAAIADAIEKRAAEFARILVQEQGKPLPEAQWEVGATIGTFRYFSKVRLEPEVLRDDANKLIIREQAPLGVVAAIAPWNVPLLLLTAKLGPALISGNCVICKPAPTTPLTTMLLGEVATEVAPPGVLQVIVDGNDLGAILTSHPDVAKISFTGSTPTGRKVMASAASTLKRLTLELGGNDAAILLEDADVTEVAPRIFRAATFNAGQICFAAKRVYAPRSKYDALCDALAEHARNTIVGDGLEQGTQMGPIQNKAQYDKVLEYVAVAKADGQVIAGGTIDDRPGYFVAPTVVRDIPDHSRLVREEQFGPVIPVLSYDGIEDVIARANDSDYGLGGTIWTSNPRAGADIARRLDTGTVWINDFLDVSLDVPVAPAKQSGIGVEHGKDGLNQYTQTKVVNVSLSPGGH